MPATPPDYIYELSFGADGIQGSNGTFYSDEASQSVVPFANAQYGGLPAISGENLLESLWVTSGSTGPDDPPTAGALLMPITNWSGEQVFAANMPGFLENGFAPMNLGGSRNSANIIFQGAPGDGVIMAVLNPPEEYKQAVKGSLDVQLDPTAPFGVSGTVDKSIAGDSITWDIECLQQPGQAADTAQVAPGSILSAFSFAAIGQQGIGLLKTNGADGAFPQLVDTSGPQGIIETQEIINSGEFWVPLFIVIGDAFQFKFRWPYSSDR